MNTDSIKAKVSLRFFATLVLFVFISFSIIVYSIGTELYLTVLAWAPVLLFLYWWKNICIDTKIVFADGTLGIIAPRVARENLPVILAITLEKTEIPVQGITAIKLWRNNHPLVTNRMDSGSSINKFVGKGQLALSIDVKDGGRREFDVNAFSHEALKDFMFKHFRDISVVE